METFKELQEIYIRQGVNFARYIDCLNDIRIECQGNDQPADAWLALQNIRQRINLLNDEMAGR